MSEPLPSGSVPTEPPPTLTLTGPNPPQYSQIQVGRLLELAHYWQEARNQGQVLSPELLCRDCPELLEPLRRHLQALAGTASAPTIKPGLAKEVAASAAVQGYDLVQELGRGGMGVVYQAWQKRPRRLVALKMVLAGSHASPTDLERFRFEAEAVAQLQHPNIVQIYEVGEHNRLPFLALEFCSAGRLDRLMGGNPLPAKEAARLVEVLARAIHYAHQCGIVHRDLKPANILFQGTGQEAGSRDTQTDHLTPDLATLTPKITDFGLAKQLSGSEHATPTGAILGTPSYMAPEQAAGLAQPIGPAADTYALGAILYELLTGRPPFKAASLWDTVFQVLHDEPVSPRQLQPTTPADLEIICLKCLQKEPHRRYPSALALAEDVRRFLAGEPIQARPIGQLERTWKWARRRPALAALVLVSFLGLLLLALSGWYFTGQVRQERDRAWLEEKKAQQQRDLASQRALEVADQLERSRRTTLTLQLVRAAGLWPGDPARGLALLEDQRYCPPDLRAFTWSFFHRLCHRQRLRLGGHHDTITSLALSPDGRTLATASWDGTVKGWDLSGGRLLWSTPRQPSRLQGLVWLKQDLVAWGDSEGQVTLWNLQGQGKQSSWRAHPQALTCLALSPDGKLLATGSEDRTVIVWAMPDGRPHAHLQGHGEEVTAVQFGSNQRLLSASRDGTVRYWDVHKKEGVQTWAGHGGPVWALAVSPDGQRVAAGGADLALRWWYLDKNQYQVLGKLPQMIQALAFAPDSQTLAVGCADGQVTVWNMLSAQQQLVLPAHQGEVTGLAFTPSGRLISAGQDRSINLWEINPTLELATFAGHAWEVTALAATADGQLLASGSFDDTVVLWDLAKGKKKATCQGHRRGVTALALAPATPSGNMLISASLDRTIRLWDLATAQEIKRLCGHEDIVSCLALSSDGSLLASGSNDQTIKLWAMASGQELVSWRTPEIPKALVFTTDGQTILSAEGSKIVSRDKATGKRSSLRIGHQGTVLCLALTPDGRLLASGSSDRTVRLWDLASGREMARLSGHRAGVRTLAFSADGRTIATGSSDGVVKIWDVLTGLEQAAIPAHQREVRALLFLDEGRLLVSAGGDHAIKLWGPEKK